MPSHRTISRRFFLQAGATFAASAGMGGAGSVAAPAPSPSGAIRYRCGFADDPATYYDVLEPVALTRKPPMLLIHGGAHTGACYMSTSDGRPGWAQAFAAKGYRVVVPDWAGTGRSGYVPSDRLNGELVIRGLGKVLESLGEPAIVMVHSMSGPFGWKLLERHGSRIEKLVAIAPGGPGNIAAPVEFLGETTDSVDVRLAPGAPVLKISRTQPFVAESNWARKKLIGSGNRFPEDRIASYIATLGPIPPQLLLERVNFGGRSPKVQDFTHYRNKRIALIVGTNDADHTPAIDKPIADWLNESGAKADFIQLGERGIRGNGHMMMLESNSDQIADGIVAWIETGSFPHA